MSLYANRKVAAEKTSTVSNNAFIVSRAVLTGCPRGKYLSALEERMKSMESMLQQSKERDVLSQDQITPDQTPPEDEDMASTTMDGLCDGTLATIIHRAPYNREQGMKDTTGLNLPLPDEAVRLSQGYFASCNHTFPIFSYHRYMQRLRKGYPPNKEKDYVWFATVLVVLTSAHRLRAMSAPHHAEEENHSACPYLRELLAAASKLTYAKPTLESAQVLLGIACILRGTAMPDMVPMLTAAAVRMLQCCNVHHNESPNSPDYFLRSERMNTFWVAYILDKDIAMQFRKPPVLHEQDIGRTFEWRDPSQIGRVQSLDSVFEVNLFGAAQSLAVIQGQVWTMIYGASMARDRSDLEAAQELLNPKLAAWKQQLPFQFRKQDLVGRWPKHAIVNIVCLHFHYFHTLVEVNKNPPLDKDHALNTGCAIAEDLRDWPHSTAVVAVEAARDALDLAALLPSGNFQNVW